MDLDELQSVQSRERQTDSLQQLRATFYQDAAEFVQGLERERDRAAERADDPWNAPEVGRLNDDIDTAQQTVEAIYERRVGKIVKMASLAAADMPTENEGLTEEERKLFETLVSAIEQNREHVFAVLDGEDPPGASVDPSDAAAQTAESERASPSESADPRESHPGPGEFAADDGDVEADPGRTPPPDEPVGADAPDPAEGPTDGAGVDAADLMSGDGSAGADGSTAADDHSESPSPPADERRAAPEDAPSASATTAAEDAAEGSEPTGPGGDSSRRSDGGTAVRDAAPSAGPEAAADADGAPETGEAVVDRSTVKITADVGEIFGVDERAYDLSEDDVVTLPEPNAGPLVERDAAERLD